MMTGIDTEAMGLGIRTFDPERDWRRVMEIGFKIYGSIPPSSATVEEFAEKSRWYLEMQGIGGFVAEREGSVWGAYLFCRARDMIIYYVPDGTINPGFSANILPFLSEKGLPVPAPNDLAELLTGTDPRHTMMEAFLTKAVCEYAEREKVGVVTDCVISKNDTVLYEINRFFGFEPVCQVKRRDGSEPSVLMVRPRNAQVGSIRVHDPEGTVYAGEPGAQR